MTALLELRGLTKLYNLGPRSDASILARVRGRDDVYRCLHAVDDVSLSIEEGKAVGLVGESGCGKSTLSRMVARLLDTTKGQILFKGEDLAAIPANRFAHHDARPEIQLVFQDAADSLNPRMTAHAAIAEPLARLHGVRGSELDRAVTETATAVGLPLSLLDRFPHQLSGGQRARVGIARAISPRPKLLILDEPTAALDVSVQAVVLQLLDELRKKMNMTYLFVSHELNVVRLLCDRVLVMYAGKVVEEGESAQVLSKPLHPYAESLVSAIPTGDPEARHRKKPALGEPVSPIDPDPSACRYVSRCARADDQCRSSMPQLERRGARAVACHYPLSV